MNLDFTDTTTLGGGASRIAADPPRDTGLGAGVAVAPTSRPALEVLDEALMALAEDLGQMAQGLDQGLEQLAQPAQATDPQLQRAVDAGRQRHVPPEADFGPHLARLARELGDRPAEIGHRQARALLESAGVQHLDAAHWGQAADAALQAFFGQLIKLPLRFGAKAVLMVPTDVSAPARGAARATVQSGRQVTTVAVRAACQPLGNLQFFGRGLPSDLLGQLRKDQQAQLERLLDNLALLRRVDPQGLATRDGAPDVDLRDEAGQQALIGQVSAQLGVGDDVQADADALHATHRELRQIAGLKATTRARVALACATVAVDVLVRTGTHVALAGMDLGLVSQLIGLATYPTMAALTQGVCNWYHTRSMAGHLLLLHRQACADGGTPSAEQLQTWAHWAQDHFQNAAQAGYHRRDEGVFQPLLNEVQRRIAEARYERKQLQALAGACNLTHYRALRHQQRLEDRLNHANLAFDSRHLARDKAAMQLMLAFAGADRLSPDRLRLLVRANAEVLLHAQAKQNQDPQLQTLWRAFQTAFRDRCGSALDDADLRLLYRERLGKDKPGAWVDVAASCRPTAADDSWQPITTMGLRKGHGSRKNYGLLRERQRLEAALEEARIQVGEAAAAGPDRSGRRGSDKPLHVRRAAALERVAQLDKRLAHLTERQCRLQQDVDCYRLGEADGIDPDGEAASLIRSRSRGIAQQFKSSLAPQAVLRAMRARLGHGIALPTVLNVAAEVGSATVRDLRLPLPLSLSRPTAAAPEGPEMSPPGHTAAPQRTDTSAAPMRRRRAATVDAASPTASMYPPSPHPTRNPWRPAPPTEDPRLAETAAALHEALPAPASDAWTPAWTLPAPSYAEWLARLELDQAACQARVQTLEADFGAQAGERAEAWSALQAAQARVQQQSSGGHQMKGMGQQARERQQATDALASARATWNRLAGTGHEYIAQLQRLQALSQRAQRPEASYLDEHGGAYPRLFPDRLPSSSRDTEGGTGFGRDTQADQRHTLQMLAELRAELPQLDAHDAVLRLLQMPVLVQWRALDLLLQQASDEGRIDLMRHLGLLPRALQDDALRALQRQADNAPLSPALAAAIAVLPPSLRRELEGKLTLSQRDDVDLAAQSARPRQGSALEVDRQLLELGWRPEAERDAVLSSAMRRLALNTDFNFDEPRGEPLATWVKAINSRPPASRTLLAQELIRARMSAPGQVDTVALERLQAALSELREVHPHPLHCELILSIRRMGDQNQRLEAYDAAARSLLPGSGAYEGAWRRPQGEQRAEALSALMSLLPSLPIDAQAARWRQLGAAVAELGDHGDHDRLPHWTLHAAALRLPADQRADLLLEALELGAAHYRKPHIALSLDASAPLFDVMPQALRAMGDGEQALRVFGALVGHFELNRQGVRDGWVGDGLTANFQPNERLTTDHLGRLQACLDALPEAQRLDGLDRLATAVCQGGLDIAGNRNEGAADVRLAHFMALGAQVANWSGGLRDTAMQRLLMQAHGYQAGPDGPRRLDPESRPALSVGTHPVLEKALLPSRPQGLTLTQELALAEWLPNRWRAAGWDGSGPVADLLQRIRSDLATRRVSTQRDAQIRYWLKHLVDSAANGFAGAGGPKVPASVTRPLRPVVDLDTPGQRMPSVPSSASPPAPAITAPLAAQRTPPATPQTTPSTASHKGTGPQRPAAAADTAGLMPLRPRPARPMNTESLLAAAQRIADTDPRLAGDAFQMVDLQGQAARPVAAEIYRMMPGGSQDIPRLKTHGLRHGITGRHYGADVTPADERLLDIIGHTAARCGSGGAVKAFSEKRDVPNRHAVDGEHNLRLIVDTSPDPDGRPSGFRNIVDILSTDGVRLVNAGLVRPGAVARAMAFALRLGEQEVYNVDGFIAPGRLTKIESVDLRPPGRKTPSTE